MIEKIMVTFIVLWVVKIVELFRGLYRLLPPHPPEYSPPRFPLVITDEDFQRDLKELENYEF